MKTIVYAAKIGLGIAVVLAAAYFLSSFGSVMDLAFGTVLMLAGVVFGVFLENRFARLFFLLSLVSFLITFLLYFMPALFYLQYLFGGFLIYSACAVMFSRKRTVIS